jgi:hypothetical protein
VAPVLHLRKDYPMKKLGLKAVLLAVCGLAATAVAVAPAGAGQPVTQPLNPPPGPEYTCTATGSGTICQAHLSFTYGPVDTGIVCGSGPSAFDIFDQGTGKEVKRRFYDANGNFTKKIVLDQYSNAYWSNPLNGDIVPYIQTTDETDILAVPGDPSQGAWSTFTGQNIYRDPITNKIVSLNAGRQVFTPDGNLESSAGPQNLQDFFDGDTSALNALCTSLGAS